MDSKRPCCYGFVWEEGLHLHLTRKELPQSLAAAAERRHQHDITMPRRFVDSGRAVTDCSTVERWIALAGEGWLPPSLRTAGQRVTIRRSRIRLEGDTVTPIISCQSPRGLLSAESRPQFRAAAVGDRALPLVRRAVREPCAILDPADTPLGASNICRARGLRSQSPMDPPRRADQGHHLAAVDGTSASRCSVRVPSHRWHKVDQFESEQVRAARAGAV